ncbi:hypothetical protein GCM10027516_35250 [Niabella aquatica]
MAGSPEVTACFLIPGIKYEDFSKTLLNSFICRRKTSDNLLFCMYLGIVFESFIIKSEKEYES